MKWLNVIDAVLNSTDYIGALALGYCIGTESDWIVLLFFLGGRCAGERLNLWTQRRRERHLRRMHEQLKRWSLLE